ncbi:37S ribosomal protein S24, mitochondrial [Sporothrix stenoceras]|uniref:37S ribosomal protein S24, mitochondrial n=1 Tax=Sporothrix stenoceras TaxID=5173 RepID=A0ABR3ZS03_9PEZI
MASASSRSLQLGVRRCCAAVSTKTTLSSSSSSSTTLSISSSTRAAGSLAPTAAQAGRIRCFSSTALRRADDDNEGRGKRKLEPWQIEMMEKEKESQKRISFAQILQERNNGDYERFNSEDMIFGERAMAEMKRALSNAARPDRRIRGQFWNESEEDAEMVLEEGVDDEEDSDEMTSMAHSKLDEVRDQRNLARVIAWEMPLLAKLAQPFEPPTKKQPLRFRYTSYMGEFHPAEKKVVVEFCPADLDLTPVQQGKLKKLAGVRFNPETEIVRISCEQFEHQAQNKRYLGDLVDRLIVEAKDPTDTFEDIPLDTRHHKFKYKPKFPREWRMTKERAKELEAFRRESFELDQQMVTEGKLVDGAERIAAALAIPARKAMTGRVAEFSRLRPAGQQSLGQ